MVGPEGYTTQKSVSSISHPGYWLPQRSERQQVDLPALERDLLTHVVDEGYLVVGAFGLDLDELDAVCQDDSALEHLVVFVLEVHLDRHRVGVLEPQQGRVDALLELLANAEPDRVEVTDLDLSHDADAVGGSGCCLSVAERSEDRQHHGHESHDEYPLELNDHFFLQFSCRRSQL